MKLKEVLKELRLLMGYTQQQLADKLFISQNTLSQYESGKRDIPTEILEKVFALSNMTIKIEEKPKEITQIVSNYFAAFDTLEKRFPTWRVFHSGGGVWLLQKEIYSPILKQNVFVMVGTEAVVAYQKVNEDYSYPEERQYLTMQDFLDNEDHYFDCAAEAEVWLLLYNTPSYDRQENATSVFTEDILNDLETVSLELGKW